MRLLRGQNRSRHLATVLVRCEKLAERADEVWLGNDLMGEPSPSPDMEGASPVPAQMWQGIARSQCETFSPTPRMTVRSLLLAHQRSMRCRTNGFCRTSIRLRTCIDTRHAYQPHTRTTHTHIHARARALDTRAHTHTHMQMYGM